MSNINIECEDDNYYDKFIEESSPRTNYGEGYKTEKMKDEYIIINKSTLEKRIEELEKEFTYHNKQCEKAKKRYYENERQQRVEIRINSDAAFKSLTEITILKQILSQSTPLIPEIEKAFDKASSTYFHPLDCRIRKQDYISNLKLDI